MGLFSRNTAKKRQRDFEREILPQMDTLYGAALRLTRSPEDAEDLVQDSVLKAYRFYDRYEAGTNFRAWLLRILTNTFINRYRRSARERKAFEGPLAEPIGDGVMSRAALRRLREPTSEAERRLIGAEIEAALDLLPEDQRIMVLLADVEELTYREIADSVGCPIGTVMSRLHRARGAMQAHLLAQARTMGIIGPDTKEDGGTAAGPLTAVDPAASVTPTPSAAPVSLETYRQRREAAR